MEQKKVQRALHESDDRYRILVEQSPLAIMIVQDTPPQVVFANSTCACITGYTVEELLAFTPQETPKLIHPQDRPQLLSRLADHIAGKPVPDRGEFRIVRKDGAQRWVEYFASLIEYDSEPAVQSMFLDITEHKQAKQALRRRADELEALQVTVLDITLQRDLPTLLETIVERAANLLNAPGGGLYLCESDSEELCCVVSYNTTQDYRGTLLTLGEGAAGAAALRGEPVLVDDYHIWEGRAAAFEQEQNLRAVLAVPMLWQGQVTGVIDILHTKSHAFTQADLDLLTMFANHAAIAVQNAKLFETAQKEITKRQRLEKQTEERRIYLERVLACAPDAIITMDAQHRVKEWNPGAEKMFGYPAEEAVGRDLDDLIAAADEQISKEAIAYTQQALSGEIIPTTEITRYRRDGTPITVLLSGSPILVEDQVVGTVAVYTDVTEHRRAEKAIRESESKYRNIVESSPMGMHMYELQPNGRLVFVDANPAADMILGVDNSQFVGKTIEEAFPALADTEIPERYRMVATTGHSWHREQIIYEENYISGAFEVHAFQTSPGKMTAAFLDITERKRAEEALRESKETYQTLVQTSPDAVTTTDLEGYITYVSQRTLDLHGYDHAEELLGRNALDFIVSEEHERARTNMNRTRELGGLRDVEYTLLKKDGTTFAGELNTALIRDAQGKPKGFIATARDISERKQAEAERKARARQQAALYHLSASLVASLDEKEICQRVTEVLHDHLGYDYLGLLLVDEATGDRILRACVGWPDAPLNSRLPTGKGLSERPLYNGELHYSADVTGEPRYVPGIVGKSEVDVPIRSGDRVFGVLVAESLETHAFDEYDFTVLTAAANQAAIALERAREHQAVKEAEVRYQNLFDRMPIGLYRSTPEGQFLDVNPALVEMLGYPDRETLLETNSTDLYAKPEHRKEWQILIEQEGVLRDHEIRFRKYDDTIIWARDSSRAIHDQEGRTLYYEGSLEDITERRRANEELRQLKEFNESIVQNVAEGIAVQDRHGTFTYVNPAAAELLGYTAEELVGQYWTTIIPPDQQPLVRAADKRRIEGTADRYEVELIRRDGSRLPVQVSGSPRFDSETGEFDGTLAVFTNISERIQAEEQLARRAQEMAALYETALEINAQRDLPTLLHAIVERASMLVGAQMGGLYLLRPDSGDLELVVGHNLASDYIGTRLQRGEGLSGRIAQTGEPMMVDDYSNWEGKAQAFHTGDFHRVLGVPLKVGDRVIGVINVADAQRTGPFDEEEVRLVSLFADQAAIAVENTRLFEAEAHRRREAETLHQATQVLSATLDLQDVFELILSHLRQVVPYDSATVQQICGDCLRIIGGRGFPNLDELLGIEFSLKAKDNPNQKVVKTRTPLILEDAPAIYEEFKREPHAQAAIRSWLGVPLLFGDQLTGMLALDKKEPNFYTEEHARLALAFAAQAAIAIENARLFEAEREQRELTEALRKAAQVMGASLELKEILRLLLEQLKRVLVYNTASVLVLRERGVPDLVTGIGFAEEKATSFEARKLLQNSPILNQMARDLQPVISDDVRQLDGWIWVPGAEHVRSWLGVPLIAQGRMIGALMVDHSQPGFYGEAELQIAQTLAQHAAQAAENAHLFEAEREQRELAEALREATAAVSSTLDLEQILDRLLEQVGRVIPSDAANISIIEGDRPRIVRWRGYEKFEPKLHTVSLSLNHTPSLRFMQETGQAIVIPDTTADPGWVQHPEVAWIRSYAGAPIHVRGQVIGFLNVDSATPNFFSQIHAERLSAFADEASLAIENARLFEETNHRMEQMATLNRIGLAITSALELDQVLNALYEQVRHVMDVGTFYVALYEKETGTIHFPLLTEVTGRHEIDPLNIHTNPGVTGYIIKSGQPLYVPDLNAIPPNAPFELIRVPPLHTQAYIGVPLIAREQVIGVLSVQSREPNAYSETDVELLTTIAAQASTAIENARLFQAEREQREFAEALRQATVAVSSVLELDQVFDEILKQVSRVLPDDSANIMLIENAQVRAVRWRGYEDPEAEAHLRSVSFSIADTPNLREMQETGQAVVIPDTTDYPGWVHGLTQVRSYAGAPIRVRDQVIGFLNINKRIAGFFNQTHADRLQVFADQAGLAIGNARFFKIMEQGKRDWETTFDAMQDAVALVNCQHRIVRANQAFADLTERPLVKIIGQNYHAVLDDQVCTAPACPLERTLANGLAATCTHAYGKRIFEVQTTPIPETESRQENGVARAIYVLSDVTERERAAKEIRNRNRELTLLNSVIAASAAKWDIETILTTVCRELAFAFSVPQSAVALFNDEKTEATVVAEYRAEGRSPTIGEIVPIAGNPVMQRLLERKEPLNIQDAQTDPLLAPIHELMRRRATMSLLVLPLLVEGKVVGSLGLDAGRPYPFSVQEVDLAQRVAEQMSSALARARLEETQRHLSAAVEQAAESIFITDTEGNITYVNPSFERSSGHSRAEALGQNTRILKSGKHPPAFYTELWETISAGQVWQGRFINRKKDGTLYTEDSTITPVRNQSGEIVNYVAVNHDVTRMVQLEEQFRQSQKMEALGQLAGGIAHDFNNLLTIIQLSTRLLQRHLRPEDPLWEYVQRIQETSERAGTLTKQLLSFSRREIVEPRLLNLSEVVGDLGRMLKRIIGEDVELVTELGKGLWPVRIDPTQVDQVILNLVINARDAMPQGGTLIIQTENVILDEAYADRHVDVRVGQYVLLSISDTGVGIADDVKDHIFEPFFTTKERGQGTGLGLAAVFGIVKQNKGHIRFYSKVNLGTTFKVYLPRAEAKKSEELLRATAPVAINLVRGTETILVVEDEPAVLDLAVRVLKACGYTVLTAGGGPEALEIGQGHKGPIHLLITDVVMPQMYGKDVADQLQSQRPEMRLLFMSGYPDRAAVQQSMVKPGVAFLSKPFTVEELTLKVRAVLDDKLERPGFAVPSLYG